MKKIYIAPEIETIDCSLVSAILNGSPLEVVNDVPTTEGGTDGEAVGASRNDWDNIWNN